jgi:cellulose synthase/poly-beta-1,6-N-acetylglucosamine synthase-like glycosyltransferase
MSKSFHKFHQYSILLPLYKETEVVSSLITAIENLLYPKDALQVLILLEKDDKETFAILLEEDLPEYFTTLIIPDYGPKTKARACNYGLKYATGKYLVIYDAEDVPERNQLLKAVAEFKRHNDPKLACLQAKLTFHNHSENLLTKFCTLEYLIQFNFVFPNFAKSIVPIPLGGTSNHFKTKALKRIKGWDMYNVTEDADITYRLCRANYSIKMLDSYTEEETVIDIKSWIRQRTRWVKGHMITFLVQSRITIASKQVNKAKFIFSLYYFMCVYIMILLLSPLLITAFVLDLFNVIELYKGLPLAIKCIFLLCPALYLYCYIIIPLFLVYKEGKHSLLKSCFIYPVYLLLYIVPGYNALFQLVYNPHYWDKTVHGKSAIKKVGYEKSNDS